MTTVGYGDIVPQSIVGKYFAMIAALSGSIVISLLVLVAQNII